MLLSKEAMENQQQKGKSCNVLTYDHVSSTPKRKITPFDAVSTRKAVKKSKNFLNKSVDVEPCTPSPAKQKHPLSGKGLGATKFNKSICETERKLQPTEEIVSKAWYYTRSLHKQVLDHIESLEHQGDFSSKGALKEWRKLLKKSDSLEDERQSLCKRGSSFVDKVGSIQGSRVYLPWKGSVLDSLIGAFLTQRVSDNFSSSAFMSIGASFPQHHDCREYGMHHRILGQKRSNAGYFPKESTFGMIGKENGSNLDKHRTPFNEKKLETPKSHKVPRRSNTITDWSNLRTEYLRDEERDRRSTNTMDYVDWDAVLRADVAEISKAISLRGMNIKLAGRIKNLLNRLVLDHGNLDLEWLKNVPPQKAKEFLLSITGIGLKSEECVRLLTLGQPAFPVDVNVARVTVRLGWVLAPPIEDKLLMNLIQQYSRVRDWIHEYLLSRLCKLDMETLYQLHCHMITFGKVFCTQRKPNCGECPMREECKHYSSISMRCHSEICTPSDVQVDMEDVFLMDKHQDEKTMAKVKQAPLKLRVRRNLLEDFCSTDFLEPPQTPAKDQSLLNVECPNKKDKEIASSRESIPRRSPARTEHSVYELQDWHPILERFGDRDPSDSSPYLLVTWDSAEGQFDHQKSGEAFVEDAPFLSRRIGKKSAMVLGTIMIPCRTALRGNFPLNGTYFQKNEVFADYETSQTPLDVHYKTLEQLPRKTLYCGTDLSRIVKGLSTHEIKSLFSNGYICTRAFDRKTFSPKNLERQLHTLNLQERKNRSKVHTELQTGEKTRKGTSEEAYTMRVGLQGQTV